MIRLQKKRLFQYCIYLQNHMNQNTFLCLNLQKKVKKPLFRLEFLNINISQEKYWTKIVKENCKKINKIAINKKKNLYLQRRYKAILRKQSLLGCMKVISKKQKENNLAEKKNWDGKKKQRKMSTQIPYNKAYANRSECEEKQSLIPSILLYNHRHIVMLCKVSYESKHKIIKLTTGTFKEIMELTKQIIPPYITRHYLYYIDKDGDQISLLNQSDFSIFIETSKGNIHVYVKEEEILQTLSNASGTFQQDSILIDRSSDAALKTKNSSILEGLQINQSSNAYHQQQSFSSIKKHNTNTKYSKIPSQQNMLNMSSRREQIHGVSCIRCKSKQIIGFRYQCPFCLHFNLCEICQKIQKHRHPLLQIKQNGQEIIHSQLRDHLNLQIPSKEHVQLAKQLEEQKKININLLNLIEEMDKNEEKVQKNKEGIFKKSLFDDEFFQNQRNHFKTSVEQRKQQRNTRMNELFDNFFQKPLISQNSRQQSRPRFSYTQPESSFTRSNRTTSYFNNF